MRHILILLAVFGLLGTALVQASERDEALAKLDSPVPEERARSVVILAKTGRMTDVPALIARLRDDEPAVRGLAEQAVWAVWNRSGDPAVDRLFAEGVAQMESRDFSSAIKTFTRIIELKPDFAEGWNKRATVYFLLGDYKRSLADCDQVLRRNPYHFGALSGYGQIYLRLEEYDKALEYFRKALAINPNLEGVRSLVEVLEARSRGRRQTI
jgi:tetratricopeptide (TPR) repeat protein